jgi:prophage maintenance system killer protein
MQYPTLDACRLLLFPIIRREMASHEPAPPYEYEERGLKKLESIFTLMQRKEYEGLFGKAAYMFCSIIDSHPFSNGNKRLAVSVLTYHLIMNKRRISSKSMHAVRAELHRLFPNLQWQNIHAFRHAHEYFFYHLALIIADRNQKGQLTFQQEQAAVRSLLEFIATA